MSDPARVVAFLDASVLYPALLRNLLMHLALRDLFQARWSDRVHEEDVLDHFGADGLRRAFRSQQI
jgi:hypothetical protein